MSDGKEVSDDEEIKALIGRTVLELLKESRDIHPRDIIQALYSLHACTDDQTVRSQCQQAMQVMRALPH